MPLYYVTDDNFSGLGLGPLLFTVKYLAYHQVANDPTYFYGSDSILISLVGDSMNSYYNNEVDAGYVKFTDNDIVKTEPISKNIYVDLDKNDKPVGVQVLGMKNNVKHNVVGKRMENSLFDL